MKSMGPRCFRVCRPVADRLRNRSDALTGFPDMLGYIYVANERSALMKSKGPGVPDCDGPNRLRNCSDALPGSHILPGWPTLTGCVNALCPSLGLPSSWVA